jgi:P4 family phage/plasmid primase-like protien
VTERIFTETAPAYGDAGLSPIPLSGKVPAIQKWNSYCDNLPKPATRAEWLTKYTHANIGLALGKELVPGFRLGAIDVDDTRFVEAARTLVGSAAPSKIGRKGETFFGLFEKTNGVKSTALNTAAGRQAIDILIANKQTVIPPSVHPETGVPYRWGGKLILEHKLEELPRVSAQKLALFRALVTSPEAEQIATGQGTHDAGLKLAAKLVAYEEDSDFLAALMTALLPRGYEGNSVAEVAGWISSAREKGFDKAAGGPLDERIARIVESELDPIRFTARDGYLHYEDGHWKKLPTNDIRRALKAELVATMGPKQLVSMALRSAEHCLALNVEDESFGQAEGKICLRNGTLDLRTGELLPHSPDHRLRYALDIDWDPAAACPVYLDQLRSTLQHDEKAAATFEEFAGLSLVSDQRFQKALYLLGEGGSGKSTLLRTIQMMHDPAAISVAPLDKLDDERYRTDVAGKLICISYDVQTRDHIFGETFIRITGGDAVTVRKLYNEIQPVVQPTVRFIGSMNPDMPPYRGAPDALRRRLIFLACGSRIEVPDPDRQAKIQAEKAGILVRWVEALKRLYVRGRFDPPDTSREEVDDYLVAYEAFDTFAAETLEKHAEDFIPVADVTLRFNDWAEHHQDKRLSANVVGRKLKRLGFTIAQRRLRNGHDSVNTRVVFARWTKPPVSGPAKPSYAV